MSILQIHASPGIHTTIHLPASKSISNRVLILNALSDSHWIVENLSDSDDTNVLSEALNSDTADFNIGAAGTSMRFLTAYLSQKTGEWTITGTERMKSRPIKILVDALRELGADIEYIGQEGFPPLRIKGKKLQGGTVSLDGGVSSQYISALMMIAPCLSEGLSLELRGNIISRPYIEMTISLMRNFGIDVQWNNNILTIPRQSYTPVPFQVESDWSAASYWYEIMALSDNNVEVSLPGLLQNSSQGDSKITGLFDQLGVETIFSEQGVTLRRKPLALNTKVFLHDFINEPDLAQTLVVTCCLMNIPFQFTGLQSLKIKETDRIQALITEMKKLGYLLQEESGNALSWLGEKTLPEKDPIISTYEDHRMAMAFAPACLKIDTIKINDPKVVSKSYPAYWEDLASAGFILTEEE